MCNEQVSYTIPVRFDYKSILIKCGNTDSWGNRVICDKCLANPDEMRRIRVQEENMAADNAWLTSAGWGEM